VIRAVHRILAALRTGWAAALACWREREPALMQRPEKSDRATAAEIGVGHRTVARARKQTGAVHTSPTKRVGRDGKARKACSWFDCDPEVLHGLVPRDPEAEDVERWYREHFRWGWPR